MAWRKVWKRREAGALARMRGSIRWYDDSGKMQSTPARGGRRIHDGVAMLYKSFQSTPARGGRHGTTQSHAVPVARFNPRPHAAGDVQHSVSHVHRRSCFNPRPHAAGDRSGRRADASVTVSIHARTRRATRGMAQCSSSADVSIHARTRRATRGAAASCRTSQRFNPRPHAAGDVTARDISAIPIGFNPRPHAAGDQRRSARSSAAIIVSIHARTRRATDHRAATIRNSSVFQSTPARGGRRHDGVRHGA